MKKQTNQPLGGGEDQTIFWVYFQLNRKPGDFAAEGNSNLVELEVENLVR